MTMKQLTPSLSLSLSLFLCMCLEVWNKALAQRMSNRKLKLLTEFKEATLHAETCVMSHQSLGVLIRTDYS